ncbi:hypothetical protein HDU97_010242 [Phlyctochytrium planicorne]|nr:hypothetical protein HDU97_010242 [Phlyctochytrium planicorne]
MPAILAEPVLTLTFNNLEKLNSIDEDDISTIWAGQSGEWTSARKHELEVRIVLPHHPFPIISLSLSPPNATMSVLETM